jgi:DmsE family decaheme c-type cytochrome
VPPGTPATTEPGETARNAQGLPIALVQFEQPVDQPSLRGTSNNLAAVAPYVCYKCHTDMPTYQQIAGPHQILGQNGFNCTTCHDPHGKIREESRSELCLQCHKSGSPAMAWHSSTHNIAGVACTDCHNPHPKTNVPQIVNISHTDIKRPKRLMMSVQEPETCYKCHQKIFSLNALPSHHPIKEGKMVCSDCHDGHGQREGNLKGETLNLVCYKCHADKQGPFVYEHPPVTENCAYCHEPHGTVANNLLRQPTTFLCLRCHTGHRRHHSGANINGNMDNQLGFYTDCTQCHTQIHGSDLRGPRRSHDFMR